MTERDERVLVNGAPLKRRPDDRSLRGAPVLRPERTARASVERPSHRAGGRVVVRLVDADGFPQMPFPTV